MAGNIICPLCSVVYNTLLLSFHAYHFTSFQHSFLQSGHFTPPHYSVPLPILTRLYLSGLLPHIEDKFSCSSFLLLLDICYFPICFFISHIGEIILFLSFSLWLISLNLILSRSCSRKLYDLIFSYTILHPLCIYCICRIIVSYSHLFLVTWQSLYTVICS